MKLSFRFADNVLRCSNISLNDMLDIKIQRFFPLEKYVFRFISLVENSSSTLIVVTIKFPQQHEWNF
jgi:hypothetical protein